MARPVIKSVQRARGSAVILKKAWREVQPGVRFFEKGRTMPTAERGERQVGQIPSAGWARMQPHAPQRGSSFGSLLGRERTAPMRAMRRKMTKTNPANARRVKGMGIDIFRSLSAENG